MFMGGGAMGVTGMSVKTESSWLLQGVSFEVPRGQLVAVTGRVALARPLS